MMVIFVYNFGKACDPLIRVRIKVKFTVNVILKLEIFSFLCCCGSPTDSAYATEDFIHKQISKRKHQISYYTITLDPNNDHLLRFFFCWKMLECIFMNTI